MRCAIQYCIPATVRWCVCSWCAGPPVLAHKSRIGASRATRGPEVKGISATVRYSGLSVRIGISYGSDTSESPLFARE